MATSSAEKSSENTFSQRTKREKEFGFHRLDNIGRKMNAKAHIEKVERQQCSIHNREAQLQQDLVSNLLNDMIIKQSQTPNKN